MCDFDWSWKTEVMGGFDFCDAKMLREGCFKKYIQAPLIGMRIWFRLILKITVRTKSYILPELCYLTKSIGKCAKLQFFSGSLPSCSVVHEWELRRAAVEGGWGGCEVSRVDCPW